MLRKIFNLAHWLRKIYWRTFNIHTEGVRVLIADEKQKVFLVNHRYLDLWVMPGGKIDKGETSEEAARREVMEESNIEVANLRKHGVFVNTREGKHDTVTVFIATNWTDHGRKWNWEIKSSGFFPIDSLPENTSRATKARINEWLSGKQQEFFGSWS